MLLSRQKWAEFRQCNKQGQLTGTTVRCQIQKSAEVDYY